MYDLHVARKKKLFSDPTHKIHNFSYLFSSRYPTSLTASWERDFTCAEGNEIFFTCRLILCTLAQNLGTLQNIGGAEIDTLIPG